jgi:hypothetical protein
MPLPPKRWFRIAEIAERWALPVSDIEDYALDEMLALSVFVVDLPTRVGRWVTGSEVPILNGPQPLLRSTLVEVFRDGRCEVRAFHSGPANACLHIHCGAPAMIVRRDDLIVTREERDRFEAEHGAGEPAMSDIWHSDDFTRVRLAKEWHSFGPKQAAVLRLLKVAGETDNPWRNGKRLLHEADAATMRLIDLFKRKPAWRQLIQADGKGRYRLHASLLSPERRRIRLFRRSGRARATAHGAAAGSR